MTGALCFRYLGLGNKKTYYNLLKKKFTGLERNLPCLVIVGLVKLVKWLENPIRLFLLLP